MVAKTQLERHMKKSNKKGRLLVHINLNGKFNLKIRKNRHDTMYKG